MKWIFLLPSFFLLGCGAHSSTAATVQGLGATSSSSVISPTAALAECNNISGSIQFTGQVSTYYESGQLVPSDLLLNITSAPSAIYSSGTAYVEIVPYTESLSGAVTDGSPSPMVFIDKLTGTASSEYPNISLSNIQSAIKALGLSSTVTASEFFARVYVLLLGMDPQYDAAKVEYFSSSQSSSPMASANFLLPIFYANPSVYQTYKPVADLENLHPFWSYLNSGYSDSEFASMDDQICQEMAGGGRIPASVGSMDGVDMVSMAKNLKGFLHTPLGARYVHLGFFAQMWAEFWVRYFVPTWQQIVHSIIDLGN